MSGSRSFAVSCAGALLFTQLAAPAYGQPREMPAKTNRTTQVYYLMRSGDTLAGIADRFYGDPSGFQRIYELNRDALDGGRGFLTGTLLILPRVGTGYRHPGVQALEALDKNRKSRIVLIAGPLSLRADRIERGNSDVITAAGDVLYKSQAYDDMVMRAGSATVRVTKNGAVKVTAQDVTGTDVLSDAVTKSREVTEVFRERSEVKGGEKETEK